MNKFSVVIPTLWKSNKIYETTNKISKCNSVKEIIIINNNYGKGEPEKLSGDKIKIINEEENIFVNPAWNKGVSISEYENICLCNDDIDFRAGEVFDTMKRIDLKGIGLVGAESISDSYSSSVYLNYTDHMNLGYGCLMFIHKKNYREIPEKMKIWSGDGFLFRVNSPNFVIQGMDIKGDYNTSVDDHMAQAKRDRDFFQSEVIPKLMSEENGMPVFVNKIIRASKRKIGFRTTIKSMLGMKNE